MARKQYSKFRAQWWKILKIDRQLKEQLRSGRLCTMQSLTEEMEVNERTVRRAMKLMCADLGASIAYDYSQRTYKYTHSNWFVPNVYLDVAEMQALATAVQAIQPVLPTSMSQRLDNLLAKLLDALPKARRDEVRRAQVQVEFVPAPMLSKGADWFEPLHQAIAGQRSVDMTYYVPARNEETKRRLDPYHLRNYQGTWYVVGYDHLSGHWPIFNLARIRELKVSDENYDTKPFSAAKYFKNTLGVVVGDELTRVRIRLTGYAAQTIGERILPRGFTYEATGPNEGILSGKVASEFDLTQWAASLQGDARILLIERTNERSNKPDADE